MILKTKPLKIKLKQSQSPLDDFMLLRSDNHNVVSKEVLFVRYIGIPDSIELYNENILKLDQYFSANTSTTSYLRMHKLEPLTNRDDITRLSTIWDHWHTTINTINTNSHTIFQTPLCSQLDNDTLEWTKKMTFMDIFSVYQKKQPNANATLLKNFAVKFLHWMDFYLPKLFKLTNSSPKIIFTGDIKQHEYLFLYFLSKLGCDICYMNPKEDIIHLYPEFESYSTLYKCSNLYSGNITIPEFKPLSINKHTLPSAPIPIAQPKIPKQIHVKDEEYSYEQLANLSSSVVMIKVYDNENNILCGGSGVVIHSDGYILTNLHVIGGGHHYSVLYENETEEYFTDHFIKYNQLYDLAVIKVEKDCSPLTVKVNGNLVRGQKIVAIGSPLGLFNSVSDGIISGFRDIDDTPMIQFTAPISSGSSGGALLDMSGRLVGLITSGFNKGQNLNLAVPAQEIYKFAENFIEHKN
ncbi:MAG: YceG family protein [Lysinibacillus sp.]